MRKLHQSITTENFEVIASDLNTQFGFGDEKAVLFGKFDFSSDYVYSRLGRNSSGTIKIYRSYDDGKTWKFDGMFLTSPFWNEWQIRRTLTPYYDFAFVHYNGYEFKLNSDNTASIVKSTSVVPFWD